jgi:hypothetical protein
MKAQDVGRAVPAPTLSRASIPFGVLCRRGARTACLRCAPEEVDPAHGLGELQAHPFGVSPRCNTGRGHAIEGQLKFHGERNPIRQQQTNAGRRKVSHGAIDGRVAFHQDRTGYADQVPRVDSPFNALVFRLDKMIGLALRQVKPLLGFKRVAPLTPCVLRAKGESNRLQRLSLEPLCCGTVCHLL